MTVNKADTLVHDDRYVFSGQLLLIQDIRIDKGNGLNGIFETQSFFFRMALQIKGSVQAVYDQDWQGLADRRR